MSGSAQHMTLAEKVYTGCVAAIAVFFGFLSGMFLLSPLPEHRARDPLIGFYYVFGALVLIIFLMLAVTVAFNLYSGSLGTRPTIVQAVILCLMYYPIPLGFWGFFLLYYRSQRIKSPMYEAIS